MRSLKGTSYKTAPGEYYGSPKELWGFRSDRGKGGPRETARAFLRANASILRLETDLSGLVLKKRIRSIGADHVIFQQVHHDRRVHRAYVTVHVGRDRRVFLAKNRAMPRDMLPEKADFRLTRKEAIQRARRALGRKGGKAVVQTTEEMWFPKEARLLPAIRVRLSSSNPRQEWITYVNARTGGLLSKYDNLRKSVRGRAWVFDPSPVTALGGHSELLTENLNQRKPPAKAYRSVTLWGLEDSGYLDGARVTTEPTRHRVRRRSHEFFIESREQGFEEVMVYHHIDSAIRYLKRLGYRGSRAIFRQPVRANVNGTREDNSWYSPWNKLLTFGTGDIDDAEDGETILHEFGHALQDAICPDFGQSTEAAAMGEGFGDYFAASFFAEEKPEDYRSSVMTWDGLLIGLEEGLDPPCLRHVDWNWTFDDFDDDYTEHENGEIWSATLWDIWNVLGRETADQIIIESHFQLDGFTTFARGARAIMDADHNLNNGANRADLRRIFRDRGIGPV
jgi:hypothetical protein